MHPAIAENNVAVITGGASGIGLATAQALANKGMRICIADIDEQQLEAAAATISGETMCARCDVSNIEDVEALLSSVLSRFGEVSLLMSNAGVGFRGAGPWSGLDAWHKIIDTNLWGMVNCAQTFLPQLIANNKPGAVVFTGSKQGLTNPPGNTAYNVSKAGVRSLAEGVAHELRSLAGCEVTAHLLVPGFTYTGLIKKHVAEKPPAAWHPEQVAEHLVLRMSSGDFYILCPDNDVSVEMDHKRLQWNTEDVILNRPALSRWHPDFAADFAKFME